MITIRGSTVFKSFPSSVIQFLIFCGASMDILWNYTFNYNLDYLRKTNCDLKLLIGFLSLHKDMYVTLVTNSFMTKAYHFILKIDFSFTIP